MVIRNNHLLMNKRKKLYVYYLCKRKKTYRWTINLWFIKFFFYLCVISLFFWKKKNYCKLLFFQMYMFFLLHIYIYIYEIKMKLALIWLNDVVIIYLTINVHLIRKCNFTNLTQIIDNFWNNDVQSNSKHTLNIENSSNTRRNSYMYIN